MLRTCACCGMPFETSNKNIKWCRHCRTAYDGNPPVKMEKRICANPECGDWFIPNEYKMIYCTPKCRQKVANEEEKARRREEKLVKKAEEEKARKIKTEWWGKYCKADGLTQDAMLARRFGFESYGAFQAKLRSGHVSRAGLELKAMQQEREKYEKETKERENNGEKRRKKQTV